jgi:serine/threonine-protein kinase
MVASAQQELESAERRAREAEARGGDVRAVRPVFEAAGAAHARVEGRRQQHELLVGYAARHEGRASDLRKQIDELRSQLQRYSDALENDLIAGRDRIASRVKEALGYEQRFWEASSLLLQHLRDKPECRDLIEELIAVDRSRPVRAQPPEAPTAPERATDRTSTG